VPTTRYPDLDELLEDFTASVRSVLGENFVALYLQGSFAVGDADEHSDVDWIAVTERELTDDEVAELQAMHQRLYGRETFWAQHLEGSYIPKALLRRVDPARTPLWYLDNGATELVRDDHCNTAVVRWSLRERGVTLAGPDPKELVDPVSADDLRAYAQVALQEWADWAKSLPSMSRRAQNLLVVSTCRILQTVETGMVTSKREAGEWGLDALPSEWSGLIREALDDRPDPWTKVHQTASPEAVEQTLAFVEWSRSKAGARA
jgi:predicted nucleotidyltransferase